MKIRNILITILMMTFFIILETKVYATTGIINEKTVKLRKAPDSTTILDYLYEEDEVEILELEDGWYKVKATTGLGKVTGYINEKEVDVDKKIETTEKVENEITENEITENVETDETISTDILTEQVSNKIEENAECTLEQEVSIKAMPLINSIEKTKITGNITVVEIINDWVRVENNYTNGWVRKNILKNVIKEQEQENNEQEKTDKQPEDAKPEETISKEPTVENQETNLNKIGYVSTEGLKVRKESTTDSEEIDSLSKNDKVQIIGQEGKWYKIDLNGKIGYVSSKYISETKVPETTSRSGSTLKNENVTLQSKQEENTVQETASTDSIGTKVVEYARQYLGYKYVSGGTSPSTGFDCSGFTQYVYKHFGISLNRSSLAQKSNGIEVKEDDLQPGDLVLFNNDANTRIGHVGIYIGDGDFIHASNPSDGVKITTLKTGYYQKRYVGARRVF